MIEFAQNIPKGVEYYRFKSNKAANEWLDDQN